MIMAKKVTCVICGVRLKTLIRCMRPMCKECFEKESKAIWEHRNSPIPYISPDRLDTIQIS